MKKCLGAMLVVAFASASTFAGTVSFSPASADALPGDQLTMDLSVSSDALGNWDAISLLMGSNDLEIKDFAFSTEMTDNQAFDPFVTPGGLYNSDLLAGIFLLTATDNALVGTLTVTVPQGLAEGSYDVVVDSAFDGDLSNIAAGISQEGLFGTATINVVPEPATLGLLSLGGLAMLRRRKNA
ncbi:MAG: PEP-CTERM sorting domain-containing protein [Planctomycetota bacterium]